MAFTFTPYEKTPDGEGPIEVDSVHALSTLSCVQARMSEVVNGHHFSRLMYHDRCILALYGPKDYHVRIVGFLPANPGLPELNAHPLIASITQMAVAAMYDTSAFDTRRSAGKRA